MIIVLLFGFVVVTNSVLLWWYVTVIITIVALINLNINWCTNVAIVNYYYISEVLGVIFILSFSSDYMFILIIIKGGFAPFHFWLISILNDCVYYGLSWILSVQKLPYYLILSQLASNELIILVMFSIVLPLVQCLFIWNISVRIFLLLTSSGNSLLLLIIIEGNMLVYLVLYVLTLNVLITPVNQNGVMVYSIELLFSLCGFPGSIFFFINLSVAYLIFGGGGLLGLLVLISLVINIVCVITILLEINTLRTSGLNSLYLFLFIMSVILYLLCNGGEIIMPHW